MGQMILEQFLKILPEDMRVFVQERNLKTSDEESRLADNYLQAQTGESESQRIRKIEEVSVWLVMRVESFSSNVPDVENLDT